jgi:hypothetical protein
VCEKVQLLVLDAQYFRNDKKENRQCENNEELGPKWTAK